MYSMKKTIKREGDGHKGYRRRTERESGGVVVLDFCS